MPPSQPPLSRAADAARWPVGVLWTGWRYLWRTTPLHRRELAGSAEEDWCPPLPPGVETRDVQGPEHGVGPLYHRRYRTLIREARCDARGLMARLQADPNVASPSELAAYRKTRGEEGRMRVGDEFLVRMAGPWDGPVRVVAVDELSFRLATLERHLEAGQIEMAADDAPDGLVALRIESWARPGDRLSYVMHHRLRIAKEVQLHMWTSYLEQAVEVAGGRMTGGIDMETRVVADADRISAARPTIRGARRAPATPR